MGYRDTREAGSYTQNTSWKLNASIEDQLSSSVATATSPTDSATVTTVTVTVTVATVAAISCNY